MTAENKENLLKELRELRDSLRESEGEPRKSVSDSEEKWKTETEIVTENKTRGGEGKGEEGKNRSKTEKWKTETEIEGWKEKDGEEREKRTGTETGGEKGKEGEEGKNRTGTETGGGKGKEGEEGKNEPGYEGCTYIVEKIRKKYEKEIKIREEKLRQAESEKRIQAITIANLEDRVDKLLAEAKAEKIVQKLKLKTKTDADEYTKMTMGPTATATGTATTTEGEKKTEIEPMKGTKVKR